eukprot:118495-Prorocentrum_lima.AAC.1
MTSSLVGSEMCIRDRSCSVWISTGSLEVVDLSRILLAKSLKPAHGGETVSYTHLTLPTICSV